MSSFNYIYILESFAGDHLYVGIAKDLPKRLKEHNTGRSFSTKAYRPWRVIHYEAYINEDDAKRREKYLKTSQGARLLKRMLKEYFYAKKLKK